MTILFVALFGISSYTMAASISCDIADASANGSTADLCNGDDSIGANWGSELDFVNSSFPVDPENLFSYIGKYQNGGPFDGGDAELTGFELLISENFIDPYLFQYTLTVPDEWLGVTGDWSFLVKQGNASSIAYLFEDVEFGVNGGFNNFTINNGGQEVNNYSHVSGFVRESDDDGGDKPNVPEPSFIALFGIGLLGMGLTYIRRKRKAA